MHQIADPGVPVEELVADQVAALPEPYRPDPRIPLPRDIYPHRLNSLGCDLSSENVLQNLRARTLADRAGERRGILFHVADNLVKCGFGGSSAAVCMLSIRQRSLNELLLHLPIDQSLQGFHH